MQGGQKPATQANRRLPNDDLRMMKVRCFVDCEKGITMDLYTKYGLRRVINAYDKATHLGGARTAPAVTQAVAEALQECFHMEDLQAAAGRALAEATGAEWGCVTACAAAGITLGAAAAMTGKDPGKIAQLPDSQGMANRIILQKGHAVNFGAPVAQLLRLAGAEVVEVGAANGCRPWHVQHALQQGPAAAVMAVESYHTAGYGGIPLSDLAGLAHAAGVPLLLDAATQELRLRELVQAGADLIYCSAHKYFAAPTAGVVVGRRDLVEAVLLQNAGIGRGMKVGKEGIVGLLAALENPPARDTAAWAAAEKNKVQSLAACLQAAPGVKVALSPDPNGCPFDRLRIELPPVQGALTPQTLRERLLQNDPSIVVRAYPGDPGSVYINTTEMTATEVATAGRIICSILQDGRTGARD
jgi:D-glucosaminate-6-phosphate ammonia-lyase